MEICITSLGTFWKLAGETVFIGTMIRGGFTRDSAVENPPVMQEPQEMWVGRSPKCEHGNPLQYSCLENPMDGEAW